VKRSKEILKKGLTNDRRCGIINKFAAKPDGSQRAGRGREKPQDRVMRKEKRFEKILKTS
jgi:hypothetical protein